MKHSQPEPLGVPVEEVKVTNGGIIGTVKEVATSNQVLAIAEIALVWLLKFIQVKRAANVTAKVLTK